MGTRSGLRGKGLLLPILALVGLMGLSSLSSPSFEEVSAADSTSEVEPYVAQSHLFNEYDVQQFGNRGITETGIAYDFSDMIWTVKGTSTKTPTIVWDPGPSEIFYKGVRGIRFGDASNAYTTLTLTLPQSEYNYRPVYMIEVYTEGGENTVCQFSCKVGDTYFGGTDTNPSKLIHPDSAGEMGENAFSMSGNATYGDITLNWHQPSDGVQTAIYIKRITFYYRREDQAGDYCRNFLGATGWYCREVVNDRMTYLNYAFLGSRYNFPNLSAETQETLRTAKADESSSSIIEQAMARYDFLVTKYGGWYTAFDLYKVQYDQLIYVDFIGRNPSASSLSAGSIAVAEKDASFFGIGVLIVLSLGVGGVLLFRRKKKS